MTKKHWLIVGGVIAVGVGVTLAGRLLAGQQDAAVDSTKKSQSEVTTLTVAHTQNYVPYDFINEKGESDGFEVAVLRAVDEKLADYAFEFVGTSDEDLLIGLESGKYDVGIKGAWYTKERSEKFIIPEEAIGASIIGFTIRKDEAETIKTIDEFAKAGGKLVPISPQNAQWTVIEEYNQAHADHPIELTAAESFTVADAYAWVLEGRYDGYFDIKLSYEKAVVAADGAYHNYAEQLSYFPYKGIQTYPLLHRTADNEVFAKAYDQAIQDLQEDGTITKLSNQYFGEDVFSYVTD